MSLYLLDSDALIDYLKGIAPTISLIRGLEQQGHRLCTCDVIESEVFSGVPQSQRGRAEQLLGALEYLTIPRGAARQAGDWRRAYRTRRVQLATTDCLIAATAVAHGAHLIARNLKDFPMPELTIVPRPQPPPRIP